MSQCSLNIMLGWVSATLQNTISKMNKKAAFSLANAHNISQNFLAKPLNLLLLLATENVKKYTY